MYIVVVHNKRSAKCIAYLGPRENIWGAVKREEGAEFHWCAFSPNIASGCSCSRILEPTWSLSTNPAGWRPLLPLIKMQRWKIFSGLSSGSPTHSLHLARLGATQRNDVWVSLLWKMSILYSFISILPCWASAGVHFSFDVLPFWVDQGSCAHKWVC